jgi:putative peptidoglycan lipid II flippase
MPSSSQTANRQIARAAGTVMAAMVLSQIFGLVAKVLNANAFGTSAESEAFFAANRFAEILFNLVAGGALASAFVPTFSGLLAHEDRNGAWRLASAVANVVTLILTSLALLSAIFAPQVVHYVLAPGWDASTTSAAKESLAADLLRIQLPSAVIFGLSGLVMGILNAHQSFLYSALAPAMYPVGMIAGLILLVPGMGVYGLAWGVVLGALLHLGVQIPALIRLPERHYRVTLGLDYPPLREVIRLMGPRLISVAVIQANFLLNTILASSQPEGSLTGITYGFALMLLPQAAIAQSIATAALPTFSALAARGRFDDLRSALAATLRGILLLALPASLGLILLRVPLIRLLLEHGEFDARSTELVAWALLWYASGLVAHSVLEVVTRAFFALKDTKTPTLITTLAMALNLGLSLLFSAWFIQLGWMPHGGLALANTTATFLEVGALLFLLRRKTGGLGGTRVLAALGQGTLATLGMWIALVGWLWLTAERAAWLQALGGVVIGGGVYGLLLLVQRVDEIGWIVGLIRRKMRPGK